MRPCYSVVALVQWSAVGLGCLGCSPPVQHAATPVYDGRWWQSVSAEEQYGFVVGYVDCYVYEYKGPAGFSDRSYTAYRDLITQFYQSNPLTYPVADALYTLQDRSSDTLVPTGGEFVFEPHSYLDGHYWAETAGPDHAQHLGFVEGYLLCHATQSRNEGGVFSKSPDEYRMLITEWYQFDERTGDVADDRVGEKIADVLFRFRDGGT